MKVILICSVEYLGDTVIAGKFQKFPKQMMFAEIAAVFRIAADCLLLQFINIKDFMNGTNFFCYSCRCLQITRRMQPCLKCYCVNFCAVFC